MCLSHCLSTPSSMRISIKFSSKWSNLRFICLNTKLRGVQIGEILMILKAVYMLIIWEILEGHKIFSSIRLRTVNSWTPLTKMTRGGNVVLKDYFVIRATLQLRGFIIQKSTNVSTVIVAAATSQWYAHSITPNRSASMPPKCVNSSRRTKIEKSTWTSWRAWAN